jgi:biotin carboxyl carrier protein
VQAAQEYTDGVFAPVPGKVVDIKVKEGDSVKEGDLVLILEAMKMENELHAAKAGTIAAVLVNKGDQTTKGQLLVAFS